MKTSATILVVDDNPTNLKLAVDLLAYEGYTMQRAGDAGEAREVLAKGPRPDLILMDIQMPGMDGLELTRVLKADPEFRGIPIVALTAFAMKGDDRKALEAGCASHISKPIDTRKLPRQIAEILARTATVDRAATAPGASSSSKTIPPT